MQASGIPAKFPLVFGKNAPGANIRSIPTASQIGIQAGAASLNDGFPPVCFLPLSGGGTPPFGQDFNGLFLQITAWCQWLGAGAHGAIPFDATYAASIGGYPIGSCLAAVGVAGYFWISTADNNSNNPDAGGANWVPFNLYGTHTTGDIKLSLKTVADPGFILMNDGSIGNLSSGGTTLASALTSPLFTLLYNNIVDAWAPIQTSGGVATTRAAQGTAAAAYAANCRLVLPKALGRALSIAGAGASLSSRALGQNLGEETHVLTVSELANHGHALSNNDSGTQYYQNPPASGNPTNANISAGNVNLGLYPIAVQNTGSGNAHNNMQPSSFLTAMVAL